MEKLVLLSHVIWIVIFIHSSRYSLTLTKVIRQLSKSVIFIYSLFYWIAITILFRTEGTPSGIIIDNLIE